MNKGSFFVLKMIKYNMWNVLLTFGIREVPTVFKEENNKRGNISCSLISTKSAFNKTGFRPVS